MLDKLEAVVHLLSNKEASSVSLLQQQLEPLCKSLDVTPGVLLDISKWLIAVWGTNNKVGNSDDSNKKVKLNDLRAAGTVVVQDDIRILKGIPPEIHSLSEQTAQNSIPFEAGAVFQGKVSNIAAFGAFIDFSAVEFSADGNTPLDKMNVGLLHQSALDPRKQANCANPIEMNSLTVGQILKVKISSIDWGRKRVALVLP